MKPARFFLLIAMALALALIVYLVVRQPAVKDEMQELRKDTKELGHDAVKGVNNAYDATKDAINGATK